MLANTILAVDTGTHTLLEHKYEFKKIGLFTLRVGSMHDAIFLLRQGEQYKFVVINEDSIPDFMDSLEALCNAARTHVFISSHSYSKTKHTIAMRLGADAYVMFGETAKVDVDCAMEHLKITPKWILRAAKHHFLIAGEIALSPTQRNVYIGKKQIKLRKMDFDILQYFIRNIGITLSYQQILHKIWGCGYDEANHQLLRDHIYVLRRTIANATGSSEYIRTEKKYGYRFMPPCDTLNFDELAFTVRSKKRLI